MHKHVILSTYFKGMFEINTGGCWEQREEVQSGSQRRLPEDDL
jgi:hypothetical protein